MPPPEGPAGRNSPDGDPVERLRRDLYRPGSTDRSVERYLAARPGIDSGLPDVAEEVRPHRPHGRLPAVLAVVLVGTAVVGGLAGTRLLTDDGPSPTRAASTSRTPLQAAPTSEDGLPRATPIPVSVAGGPGGESAVGRLYRGRGNSRFPLDVDGAPTSGGRVVIGVTASDGAAVSWRLLLVGPPVFPTEETVAAGGRRPRPEPTLVQTVRYQGLPPQRFEVRADDDVRWTVFVVYVEPAR